MTIDWDKPIETTDGFPARLISSDYRIQSNTVMLVQIDFPDKSVARAFHKTGRPYWAYEGTIRNRKTKREGWINICPDQWVGNLHESEETARQHPNARGAIATLKIEWEE
jgi:hypothetical protein